jgi:hypothetical protein
MDVTTGTDETAMPNQELPGPKETRRLVVDPIAVAPEVVRRPDPIAQEPVAVAVAGGEQ